MHVDGLSQNSINSIFDLFDVDVGSPLIDAKLFVSYEEGRELAQAEGAYAFHEMSSLTQNGIKEMFDSAIRCVFGGSRRQEPNKQRCAIQ